MAHLEQRAGTRRGGRAPSRPGAFETALLRLGEEAGKLEECLLLLSEYFDLESRALQRVIRQAAYPMFTALAATFLAPAPLLFTGAGVGAYVVTVVGGLGLWLLAGGSLLLGTVRRRLARPPCVLGRLLRSLTFAIEAGLPLGRALTLAADASGDEAIRAHVTALGAMRASTQPLAVSLRGCPGVPFEVIAALEVAEASGDYGGTLRKLAELIEG